MSLVRDYAVLLDQERGPCRRSTRSSRWSRASRRREPPTPLPLEESYPIVNCDPTQASAIALARTGKHFIIQGPPGTGKSQTITNLIADFVAQGKRVLFVCEKRAAIDVVYHRLHQAGLHELCCLIHDAQDDKKEFILDLKADLRGVSRNARKTASDETEEQRGRLLAQLQKGAGAAGALQRGHAFVAAAGGLPLRQLLQRAVELARTHARAVRARREQLPAYQLWHEHRERIERLHEHLRGHPAGRRAGEPSAQSLARPFRHERTGRWKRSSEALPRVEACWREISAELQALDVPAECWDTLDKLRQLVDYAELAGVPGGARFARRADGEERSRQKADGAFARSSRAKGQELQAGPKPPTRLAAKAVGRGDRCRPRTGAAQEKSSSGDSFSRAGGGFAAS